MKIAITTIGTRGDLQPYVALGIALKKNGHDVLIISSRNEEDYVKKYGLGFFALNVDIQKLMQGDDIKEMAEGNNPLRFIWGHLKGAKKMKQLMVDTQSEIWDACQTADLIMYHPGMPIGFFIAGQLGKFCIMANPFPVVPTDNYPAILFYPWPRLGKLYNRLTHFVFDKLFWSLTKPAIVEFWRKTVKSKMNFSVSPLRQHIKSNLPVINGYSQLFFPQPKEWGNHIDTTGAWLIEDEPNFTIPKGLAEFISEGDTPVYIGFGSMKDGDFQTTLDVILKALELCGKRAVVSTGWNNLASPGDLPDHIFLAGSIPHSWLFPQVCAVVHHGGAGTTSAGLIAGKPTAIIAHNADQPAWGLKVYELGVGAKPIMKTKLTSKKLSDAILFALQPTVAAKAYALGQQLKTENGLKAAVEIIERYVSPPGSQIIPAQ